jgi:hypothetical protein
MALKLKENKIVKDKEICSTARGKRTPVPRRKRTKMRAVKVILTAIVGGKITQPSIEDTDIVFYE